MKRFFLILGLSWYCCSGFATYYEVGGTPCYDFDGTEKEYYDQINDPDPFVSVILVYAGCLLVKGQATNNQSDIYKGLDIFYNLADNYSNVVANYYLAVYYYNGGTFKYVSNENLYLAADYFSRVLALIDRHVNYPAGTMYISWEKTGNIELPSYYNLPRIYMKAFYLGAYGDYNQRLLNSPTYDGDRDLDVYAKYNKDMMGNIDLAIELARNCKNLPMKSHFHVDEFYKYKKACALYEETSILMKEIQWKRLALLNENRCREDVFSEECHTELEVLNDGIISAYSFMRKEVKRIVY